MILNKNDNYLLLIVVNIIYFLVKFMYELICVVNYVKKKLCF